MLRSARFAFSVLLLFSCSSVLSSSDLSDEAGKLGAAKLKPYLIKCGDSSFMAEGPFEDARHPKGYFIFRELKDIHDVLFLSESASLTDADRRDHWEYKGSASLSYAGPVRFYDTRENRWQEWKTESVTIPVTVEKQKGKPWSVELQWPNGHLKEIRCADVPDRPAPGGPE